MLVVQDRVTLESKQKARLSEAIEAALRLGKGALTVVIVAEVSGSKSQVSSVQSKATKSSQSETWNLKPETFSFSTDWRCANCDLKLPAPTPGLFSFNNPIGACPTCKGFGQHARAGSAEGDA